MSSVVVIYGYMKNNIKNMGCPKIDEGDFYKIINDAISKERHSEYLKDVIVQYKKYKSVMSDVFLQDDIPFLAIFKFRIEYLLKKPVWREIEIFGSQTLENFAETIVDSMGWLNDHLHAFYLPEKRGTNIFGYNFSPYGINSQYLEDDPYPTYKTNQIRVANIDYVKHPKMGFVFDFGDGHVFHVIFRGMRAAGERDNIEDFPKLVDQRGVASEQYPNYEEA